MLVMKYRLLSFLLLMSVSLLACEPDTSSQTTTEEEAQELNLYTHRHYESDKQLIAKFTEETGITVNVVNASADELILKMENEGEQSPADVLITVDAGRLERAKNKDLFQSVNSDVLAANIPAHLREQENYWFAFTKRARIIAYDKEQGMPANVSSYEDLAKPAMKGKVVIRSSGNIYNQSLMASMIANLGEAGARTWAEGVVGNMARPPKGNDRDQMKAVIAGEGEVAVVNTYYLGHLLNSEDPDEVEVGNRIGLIFPNQDDRGTHINISGAGVARYAPNKENAIRFIEFLSDLEAQRLFAAGNYEFPVNPKANVSDLLSGWGDFKEDQLNLEQLGVFNKQAVLTFDEVGWK